MNLLCIESRNKNLNLYSTKSICATIGRQSFYRNMRKLINPFIPGWGGGGFPIYECLALDRVKSLSVSGTYRSERVNCYNYYRKFSFKDI